LSPLPPQREWKYVSVRGEWSGKSAGGCRNFQTCPDNAQYLLKVRKQGDVTILLSQSLKKRFDAIGFYVVQTSDSSNKLRAIKSADIVCKTEFARPTEAVIRFNFLPRQKYVIVPCTFDRGQESQFKLEVFSETDVKMHVLKDPQEVAVRGEWVGSSAGGCVNHPSWRSNPQYFLFMKQQARLTITLTQHVASEKRLNSIGFYVARSNGHRLIVMSKEDIVGKGAFEKKRSVVANI
jgi:Calpain large subunit, domain III